MPTEPRLFSSLSSARSKGARAGCHLVIEASKDLPPTRRMREPLRATEVRSHPAPTIVPIIGHPHRARGSRKTVVSVGGRRLEDRSTSGSAIRSGAALTLTCSAGHRRCIHPESHQSQRGTLGRLLRALKTRYRTRKSGRKAITPIDRALQKPSGYCLRCAADGDILEQRRRRPQWSCAHREACRSRGPNVVASRYRSGQRPLARVTPSPAGAAMPKRLGLRSLPSHRPLEEEREPAERVLDYELIIRQSSGPPAPG